MFSFVVDDDHYNTNSVGCQVKSEKMNEMDPWIKGFYIGILKKRPHLIPPIFANGTYFETLNDFVWNQIWIIAANEQDRVKRKKVACL